MGSALDAFAEIINTSGDDICQVGLVPDELVVRVLSYIKRKEKVRCRRVCSHWKRLLDVGHGREYWGWTSGWVALFGGFGYNFESLVWITDNLDITNDEAKFCDCFVFYKLCAEGRLADAKWFAQRFAVTPAEAKSSNNRARFWAEVHHHFDVANWLSDEFGCLAPFGVRVVPRQAKWHEWLTWPKRVFV